ncbi:MAG: hypothetical protein ACPG1A_00890 [Halioglobus sp.]
MSDNADRARRLVPSIILTVLSMIQAIALELFWGRLSGSEFLWQGGIGAVIGWLQFAAMFSGILLIWLMYVNFVLRFTWLPSLEDTLTPFFIGVLEFAMIDLSHPDTVGPWLVLLALTFVIAVFASHTTMRKARKEASNAYFFRQVEPATWRDYQQSGATVLVLGSLGAVLWIFPHWQWLAVISLLLALLAQGYQYRQAHHYWLHSIIRPMGQDTDQ